MDTIRAKESTRSNAHILGRWECPLSFVNIVSIFSHPPPLMFSFLLWERIPRWCRLKSNTVIRRTLWECSISWNQRMWWHKSSPTTPICIFEISLIQSIRKLRKIKPNYLFMHNFSAISPMIIVSINTRTVWLPTMVCISEKGGTRRLILEFISIQLMQERNWSNQWLFKLLEMNICMVCVEITFEMSFYWRNVLKPTVTFGFSCQDPWNLCFHYRVRKTFWNSGNSFWRCF